MPIRIVLADDSVIVRQGILQLLEGADDIDVVAICADAGALRQAVADHGPDVVVTDIRMPPSHSDEGIQFAAWLREAQPRMGVVVLSQYAEPEYALELLEAGSDRRAYLLKERVRDRAQLTGAIRAVANGSSVVDPKIVEVLVSARDRAEHSPLGDLTPREREVLAELAQGKSNSAIAESLVLTKRAVEKHINAIFFKLDLADAEDVSKRVKATLLFLAGDR